MVQRQLNRNLQKVETPCLLVTFKFLVHHSGNFLCGVCLLDSGARNC